MNYLVDHRRHLYNPSVALQKNMCCVSNEKRGITDLSFLIIKTRLLFLSIFCHICPLKFNFKSKNHSQMFSWSCFLGISWVESKRETVNGWSLPWKSHYLRPFRSTRVKRHCPLKNPIFYKTFIHGVNRFNCLMNNWENGGIISD